MPFTPSPSPHPKVEVVTPPDTPTPTSASGVAYSLVWSGRGCIGEDNFFHILRTSLERVPPADSFPSAPRIAWADKVNRLAFFSLPYSNANQLHQQGKWRADASPERVEYRPGSIATQHPTPAVTNLPLPLPNLSSTCLPEVPPSSTTPMTPSYPLHLPTLRTDRPRPVSNAKQSKVHQKNLRRIKSTRFYPTKLAHLRLKSQVKWHLQEARWWKRLADRPTRQMKIHQPPPPPHYLPLPPPPRHLPPFLAPVPLPIPQRASIPRAAVPAPKRLKAIKRIRRLKTTRPKPYKMEYLRLRSEVKWRLKDLGIEKRPPPSLPPPPAVSTQPAQVHPILVMLGPLPAWLWPAGVFFPPPDPVAPTPQQAGRDASIRLSVLTSQDPSRRIYGPRRWVRLIPDESAPMEGVEFFGLPP